MKQGAVRVVSKRKGGVSADPSEVVIDVDRDNPILGNPHILRDHRDDAERARVIAAYERDFNADMAREGPMFREVLAIAARVASGDRVALRCWCAPRRCHAEIIAARVREVAGLPLPNPVSAALNPEPPQGSLF